MKNKLRTALEEVKTDINGLLAGLQKRGSCILCDFEEVHKSFVGIHTMAATYYLKTYLQPFTENYIAISLATQHLSARKHGALIVVQRNEPLDD